MHGAMDVRVVTLPDTVDARVGEALWRLHDTRQRTLEVLRTVEPGWMERMPVVGENTIGTLLYHVALIELDWLFADLLHEPFPSDAEAWFPTDVRDAAGLLRAISPEPLERHLERLAWVRSHLDQQVSQLDSADLDRVQEKKGVQSSGAWVLHHLAQHEAEHRGQIQAILTGFGHPEPS